MSRSLGFRPSHTQLVAAFLSVASVGIASVTACSKESKSSEAPSTPVFPSFLAADVGSLPACVAERGGALA